MNKFITITSKGQATIPVEIRNKLGIPAKGGKLQITFDDSRNMAMISKPLTLEGLSQQLSKKIKAGTTPVTSVDEYYQEHRQEKNHG